MQLNHLNRYASVLDHIKRTAVTQVLDVGCGSLGMGEFTDVPFVGCDTNFVGVPVTTMMPVRGSAIYLPFCSNSFDLVVSLDMIEHLSPQNRATAISELLRVSRSQVIFGCPCGNSAWYSDFLLSKCFSAMNQRMPTWLSEHMAAPFSTRTELEAMLDETCLRYRVLYNESIMTHQAVIVADIVLLGWLLRSVTFRKGALVGDRLPAALSRLTLRLRIGPPYRWVFVVEKATGITAARCRARATV